MKVYKREEKKIQVSVFLWRESYPDVTKKKEQTFE